MMEHNLPILQLRMDMQMIQEHGEKSLLYLIQHLIPHQQDQ